jgi:hypothetical protein
MTRPTPRSRTVQAAAFLRRLHAAVIDAGGRYDPAYRVEIRPLAKAGGRSGYRAFDTVDAAAQWAVSMDTDGVGVYYGVHLRRADARKGGDAAVAAVAAAFADVDCEKHGVTRDAVRAVLAAAPWGPPALIVESGGGLHPIWPYREPVPVDDAAGLDLHTRTQHAIRAWLNAELAAPCADDMSSRDRILRLPGTHNRKPERRTPSGPPLAHLVAADGVAIEPGAVLDYLPDAGPSRTASRARYEAPPMPVDIPARVGAVLAAAGLTGRTVRDDDGGIVAVVLDVCPACGDTRGKCHVTPSGRLRSKREHDCPAGHTQAGPDGLALAQWVALYAPDALDALATTHAPDPPPPGVHTLDVRTQRIGRDVLRDVLRDLDARGVALFSTPPGVGKSEAALIEAVSLAAKGRRVLYLVENHALAAEMVERARGIAAVLGVVDGVAIEHARGMATLCQLPSDAPDPARADAIRRAAATMGRRMCTGCPLARRDDGAGGTCDGWRRPTPTPRTVMFAAHAAAASLTVHLDDAESDPADEMGAADLVIVDELPRLVQTSQIGPAHLETLIRVGLTSDVRRWHAAHTAHGVLAAELIRALDTLAASRPHGEHADRGLTLAAVLDDLRGRAAVLDAARGVVAEIADEIEAARRTVQRDADALTMREGRDPTPAELSRLCRRAANAGRRPPMPRPADARRGVADRWPDPAAWAFVRMVAEALTSPQSSTVPLGDVLRVDADGWTVERRDLYALPAGPRVLALDATGSASLDEWRTVAARRGGELRHYALAATGETPDAAEHYHTGRLRTPRLWTRTGRRVAFLPDAPGAVRNALLRAAGAVPCAVGILTHKPLADALRWGIALADDPDAVLDPEPGAAVCPDDVHALAVAGIAAELVARGWSLTVGHYGRDARGTNAFEAVDVLAVLGAPRNDYGATVADAAALGVDAAALAASRSHAEIVQALARSRYLTRSPDRRVRLFVAAEHAPTGAELPGVVWTVHAADRSHAPSLASIDAAREIAAWADRHGALDVAAVRAVLTPHVVGRRVADRLCRDEAERRGWSPHREGREGRTVYRAPDTASPGEIRRDSASLCAHRGGDVSLLLVPMSAQRLDFIEDSPAARAPQRPADGVGQTATGGSPTADASRRVAGTRAPPRIAAETDPPSTRRRAMG